MRETKVTYLKKRREAIRKKYPFPEEVMTHYMSLGKPFKVVSDDHGVMIHREDSKFKAYLSRTRVHNIQFYYAGRISKYYNSSYESIASLQEFIELYDYYEEELKDAVPDTKYGDEYIEKEDLKLW